MNLPEKKVIISLISFFSILSIIFYLIVPNYVPFSSPCDVDYIYEGEYAGNYIISPIWGNVVIVD